MDSSSDHDDIDELLSDRAPPEELSDFDSAASHVRSLAGSLGPEDLLYLYARYKVGTEGPCLTPKPGFLDFQGRKKWAAWKGVSWMSREASRQEYVQRVRDLDVGWNPEEQPPSSQGFGLRMSRPVSSGEERSRIDSWIALAKCPEDFGVDEWAGSVGRRLDVGERDGEGLTALHWACDRGRRDLVDVLIREGAEVDSRAEDGQTPLHYAVSCGHKPVVLALLSSGADANIRDVHGLTPGDLAEDDGMRRALSSP